MLLSLLPMLVIVLAFILITVRTGTRAARALTVSIGEEIALRINEHVSDFLDRAVLLTATSADLIARGVIADDDSDALRAHFHSQIALTPALSSIYFGNTQGGLVGSGAELGYTYLTETEGFIAGEFRKIALTEDGSRSTVLAEVPSFDARTRAWYEGARRLNGTDGVYWSAPYMLATGHDRAVAVARPVAVDGAARGVVAADIFISDLERYLVDTNHPDGVVCYIVGPGGLVIAASESAETVAAIEAAALAAATGTAETRPLAVEASHQKGAASSAHRFRHGGEWLTTHRVPLSAATAPPWTTVTVVRESVFLAETLNAIRSAIVVAITSLIIVVIIVLRFNEALLSSFIAILRQFADFTGDALPAPSPPARLRELDDLAESFQRMARELHLTLSAQRKAVTEREVLIRELHHRTKNNLNVVGAMVRLRLPAVSDPAARALLSEIESRIQTMGLVHQKLYRSRSLSEIDLVGYLHELGPLLNESLNLAARGLTLGVDASPVLVSVDVAIALGLVVNELVTNAAKHAFPDGQAGKIEITAASNGNEITLTVADSGRGMDPHVDPRTSETIGLQTVLMIIEYQLGGSVRFFVENGLRCECTVPVPHDHPNAGART